MPRNKTAQRVIPADAFSAAELGRWTKENNDENA